MAGEVPYDSTTAGVEIFQPRVGNAEVTFFVDSSLQFMTLHSYLELMRDLADMKVES